MSQRYLVPCPSCGKQLPVSASQAGQSVACVCGASVEAPTLRRLRELPAAPDALPAVRRWGARQGIVTAGIAAAAVALGLAGYLTAIAPSPEAPFRAADFQELITPRIDEVTPAQAWSMWHDSYEPLGAAGFLPRRSEGQIVAEAETQQRRFYALALTTVGGAALATALLAALLVRNE